MEQFLSPEQISGQRWIDDVREAFVLPAQIYNCDLDATLKEKSFVQDLFFLMELESRINCKPIQTACAQLQLRRQQLTDQSNAEALLDQFRIFKTAIDCPEFYDLH